jgi:cysteine synthase A
MVTLLPDRNMYLNRLSPTPLTPIQLDRESPVIWVKLEFLNPSGSTKDRIARYILEKAWREGHIDARSTVIEASSGSTSIAMALACAQLGVRFVAVMPEGVSNERVLMIRAYGGEICFTPKADGIAGSLAETKRLATERNAFLPRQFSNPDNPRAHQVGTAREILDQIPGGSVDAVVSGVGTGGTLVGLYDGLRDGGCAVTPFLARPVNLSGPIEAECCSFSSCIPGVMEGASTIFHEDRLPGLQVIEVRDEQAIRASRRLIACGFPVGPSSGLNFEAAIEASRRMGAGARVVTVFPDRMERYFTTDLFIPFTAAAIT